ncbi:hypothetical protein BDR04DRAFT_205469 [Suillus decipiens]|nr:hypothetical protein BDR04DRAFT_205469 [Suillus decipiens]
MTALDISSCSQDRIYSTSSFIIHPISRPRQRGFVVIWIMSQRILIHLRELSEAETRRLDNVVVVRSPPNARDEASDLRSPLTPRHHVDPEFGFKSSGDTTQMNVDLPVRGVIRWNNDPGRDEADVQLSRYCFEDRTCAPCP